MKPVLTQIFVTLGVIFLGLVLIGIYFFVADPMNLKPMIFGSDSVETQNKNENTAGTEAPTDTPAGGFQLSAAQKEALVALGIDPAQVPSSISVSQEACFVSALGEARVGEIKAGAVPNPVEFLKAKSCI